MIKIKIETKLFIEYENIFSIYKMKCVEFVTGNAGKQVLFIRWPKLSHTLY
jgi:hypothetical protein